MSHFFSRRSASINPSIASTLADVYSADEMESLSRLGTIIEIKAGETFATEGSVGHEAVVIVSGNADVVRDGETIASVGAGTVLGEMSLITGKPRNASLVAHDVLSIAVMNRREFRSLLDDCPRLADEIVETMRDRASV